MTNEMVKLFEDLRKRETTKIESKAKKSEDNRFIKFEPENTYRLRLLFTTSPTRSTPFINKFIHSYYGPSPSESGWVTCPTSEYVEGNAGFKNCPICTLNSKYYKDGEAGSPSAVQLYKTFKRKFYGFVPVYVVSDSSNPENNGKVLIMKFGYNINDFIKRNIFGIDAKSKKLIVDDELIGIDAFDIKNGYDMLISVGQNKTKEANFNSYTCAFSKKKTSIPITEEKINSIVAEMNFDKDFSNIPTKAELDSFVSKFVMASEIATDIESDDANTAITADSEVESAIDDEVPITFKEDVNVTQPAKVEEVKKAPAPKKEAPKPEVKEADADDDIDIAALLAKVDENYSN